MGSLIDAAVAHFSNQEVRSMEVPAWDVTIFAKNLSLSDKAKWLARSKDDTTDYMVYAVIYGAVDEKGEPLFDISDKPKLRNSVDPDVLSSVANFVLKLAADSEEEREKNS
jgi:hypothetical protein